MFFFSLVWYGSRKFIMLRLASSSAGNTILRSVIGFDLKYRTNIEHKITVSVCTTLTVCFYVLLDKTKSRQPKSDVKLDSLFACFIYVTCYGTTHYGVRSVIKMTETSLCS